MDTPPPINSRLLEALTDFASQVTWEHAIAVGLVICGAFFWLHGGRLVKTLFLLVAGISGAMLGGTAAVGLGLPEFANAPPALLGAIIGGALGVIVSIVLFRMAMAGCGAIALAAAASLLTLEVLAPRASSAQGPAEPPARISITSRDFPSRDAGSSATRDAGLPDLDPSSIDFEKLAQALRDSAPDSDQLREALLRKALGVQASDADSARPGGGAADSSLPVFDRGVRRLQETHTHIAARIASLDPGRKLWFVGLAASGAAVGFLFGLVMPRTAAAAISAAMGALAIVAGSVWLFEVFNPPWLDQLDQPVWVYAALVVGLWVIGFRSQIRHPRTDRKPAKDAETT